MYEAVRFGLPSLPKRRHAESAEIESGACDGGELIVVE